ncbi:hypothetical protein OAC06_01930 [Alphaproteobacteria bacterium]|nr:hypothetical protein [Alphaproteobacteria bacterium]
MLKILFIFITLTLTGFITIWFKNDPGIISIVWQGWLIEASIPIISILILLLFFIILILYFFIKKILFFPKSLHTNHTNRRRLKADTAIIKAFAAKYMGEIELAKNYSNQAKFLNNTPLKLLLDSEINNYYGNDLKSLEYHENMLEHPETLLMSIKKITIKHINNKDIKNALKIINMSPKSKYTPKWFFYTSLQLNILDNNWGQVTNCIRNINKYTDTNKDSFNLIKSKIFLHKALEQNKNNTTMFKELDNSLKFDPSFAPAIVLKAQLLYQKDKRLGLTYIQKSWKKYSHPDISDCLIKLFHNESKYKLLNIIKFLIKLDNDTYKNAALANAALQLEAWPLARQAINLIPEKNWTKSIYLMMADLDKKEHGDINKFNFWQEKSQNALLDFSWGCTSCSYIPEKWKLICKKCSSLDSIQWQQFSMNSNKVESFPVNTKYSKLAISLNNEDAARGIIKDLNTGIDR